ncbi:tetratricopeptide repeat protein [Parabacteroides sp. PF5-9]|uniref:tetratricopeptide repeat protein n=1 Tax=Parabacteroides sp. PF5-9 TaxID=1742404 RepID=UPI00247637BA|nr:tetratricopeptide repeat protein [Parabacteroides sp. PF5-9]MDH6358384.1 tetratricopeptide (TPR) repeat protein [Parabacteroides sp. PF5-9]
MKKYYLLLFLCSQILFVAAQNKAPRWMDKQRKAVISITTYGADEKLLHTGSGCFVTETGEAISAYSLFKGASKAVVTDTDGNQYQVSTIIGADELYDVIRFKVSIPKKVPFLKVASEPVAEGATVYLVAYTTGKTMMFKEGTITEVSKLKEPFSYYKTSVGLETDQLHTPFLTANGEVLGLAQEDAAGNTDVSYIVSAGYINSLYISSTDAFNSAYNAINIRKAWPSDPDQAQVSLFLLANSQDAPTYLATLNDFIATFPDQADGYVSRANHYAYNREELASDPSQANHYLTMALEDLNTAAKYDKNKGNMLFNKAKLIYGVSVNDTTLTDPEWTIDKALQTVQQAIGEQDLPVYRQLEGDIYFYQGRFVDAYKTYMIVNNSDIASSSSFYSAAKALENIPGVQISDIIALFDKAIEMSGVSAETFVYLQERIEYKMQLMLYDEAIKDYDLFYSLLNGRVNDEFYYNRKQAKFRSGDMDGALADIQTAIRLVSDNPNYYAEEASIYIRQEDYTKALESVEKALALSPDFASCYRLKGVCLVRQNQKDKACEAFAKAKELGDPVVDRLIREHCQ